MRCPGGGAPDGRRLRCGEAAPARAHHRGARGGRAPAAFSLKGKMRAKKYQVPMARGRRAGPGREGPGGPGRLAHPGGEGVRAPGHRRAGDAGRGTARGGRGEAVIDKLVENQVISGWGARLVGVIIDKELCTGCGPAWTNAPLTPWPWWTT